jgi:hypothetical protein
MEVQDVLGLLLKSGPSIFPGYSFAHVPPTLAVAHVGFWVQIVLLAAAVGLCHGLTEVPVTSRRRMNALKARLPLLLKLAIYYYYDLIILF